ncbi:uncharacterized protein map3k19 [Pristis pectinata]|uniref:uncharacterized protein map3k19 n=1 Tax=Pristis pectinata TaxID=685728 RepID=UPI00223CBCF1|nr:uncharacterized protein map3k19 [Pristis pectinata]
MDKINPTLDCLVIASKGSLETRVQSQMQTEETTSMSIDPELHNTDCRSPTGPVQQTSAEDVDILEKLGDLTTTEHGPVKMAQEFLNHNKRSVLQYEAQVKSTLRNQLTNVLPNQLPQEDSFFTNREKNHENSELSICGSQVFQEDLENTKCLCKNTVSTSNKIRPLVKQRGGTNTEIESQAQKILLCFNSGKNILQEMICVYNKLESSCTDTALTNLWKHLDGQKHHQSSLPDETLLDPVNLRKSTSLNPSTRNKKRVKNMPNLKVISETQGSQLEPNISKTEAALDSSQDTKTNVQQMLEKQVPTDLESSRNSIGKVSLAQSSTSIVRSPVPVRLLPIEGEQVTDKQNECGISDSTAITSHSKQNSSYSFSPPESSMRTERLNAHSLAEFNRQNSVSEYTSISASINQTSSNKDVNPKQTQSHKPLCLEIHPSTCTDCVSAGTKIKHEDLLDEEVAKNLCAMDVTYNITLEGKGECTSVGSDKYIYKCEELDIAKTSLTNKLTDVNYGKDDIVLLDVTLCREPTLQMNKSLPCAKENMSANVLKSANVGPNETKNLQNEYKTKISANEALASEQEVKQVDTLFQGDKLRESIIPGGIPLKLAEFGQCVSMPKQIVGTKYTSSVKKEKIALKDKKTKYNTVENITMAKQMPTKTLQISKCTSVKMKDANFEVPHNANSSFSILSRKEKEVKRKMNKMNCINQWNNSTPERNKSSSKSLQCLPISTQSWLRKDTLMPSTACFLQCKKTPGFPSLDNSHLHQVSSKVPTKLQGGTLKNGSTSNEKSYSSGNRNINSLNKSPIPQVPRLNSTSDFSALKYSDMFQEINPIDKGPGIYEMFSSPLYRAMRKSTTCATTHQTVHSVPQRRGLTYGSVSSHQLPGYEVHLDGQYLSTIIEDSFEKTSVKSVTSESHDNIHNKSSAASVDGGNLGDYATDHHMSSMLPKIIVTDNCDIDLFELEQYLNKKNEADIKSAKRTDFVGTNVSQDPTAVLSNGINQDVVVDEAETTFLCPEDQDNISSYGAKATSHPNANQTSFPVQPLINTWTVEQMNPAFQFKCGKEDSIADGRLNCLTSALLLEEKNTYDSKIQVATHVQQKECYGNKDNESENTNEKMINEKSFQSAEYTVTKLSKTSSRPSSSLCNTIRSECSSNCEDVIIWTKGNVLGKGAYGTVYCGLTSQGQLIAVKQVVLDATNQTIAEKEYQKLEEEIELLKDLKHVNIVHFLGTNLEANVVSIFMEFVPGGSIAGIISCFGPLSEPVFCGYTKQVLKGVDYLHDNKVIHRDIKGNNVMLMPNGVIKLIDFGCAKRMTCVNMNETHGEMLKSMHGTPYWMAPEVINETGHGKKSDIWSIGCTVFEMASGKPPLAHMDKMAAMFYIGAHRGLMPNLPDQFSENAQDFVQICLTRDQHKRPSAKQLLQHAFIIKKQKKQPFQESKIVVKAESQVTIVSKNRSLGITEL